MRLLPRLASLQGVAGALLVAGGILYLFGVGWAAIALGSFLLMGAWSRR